MHIKLTIDDREIDVPQGATILDAAKEAGVEIPTMCFLESFEPSTSCMVCMVKLSGSGALVPACGRLAEDGMEVDTQSEAVLDARRAALELLLSDHLGDCVAPCRIACPAGINIPLMIRLVAEGRPAEAMEAVMRDIAFPAVLGRICHAPCEKACRRGQLDESVSICLLKRFVGDAALKSEHWHTPATKDLSGKTAGIIGAGPAGLTAAYYLRLEGHAPTVFDDHEKPGGMLRYGIGETELPRKVLNLEIERAIDAGIDFRGNTRVGKDIPFERLGEKFDAVFIASGSISHDAAKVFGLPVGKKGVEVEKGTYQTDCGGVFAGGGVVHDSTKAVRSMADGKEAARAIDLFLAGKKVSAPRRRFNSRFGRLKCGEETPELFGASSATRNEPEGSGGLTAGQIRKESLRCLDCGCGKPEHCKLREMAERYGAKGNRYRGGARALFSRNTEHSRIVYEPGKCIKCGVCVQIAAESGEETGLSFIGRGFHVHVDVPFKRSIKEGMRESAEKCVSCCPTGALALNPN